MSWRQLRSGSQLFLGAAHHSQHPWSCQEQEAHAPMMMLRVLGGNRCEHIPTQKSPAVPAILSYILCSCKLMVTEEMSTGMWAVSTRQRVCWKTERGWCRDSSRNHCCRTINTRAGDKFFVRWWWWRCCKGQEQTMSQLSVETKAGAMESFLILIIIAQWAAVLLEQPFFESRSPRNIKFRPHVSVIQQTFVFTVMILIMISLTRKLG